MLRSLTVAVFTVLPLLLNAGKPVRLSGGTSYYVKNEKSPKSPTLIMVPEWWGLTPYVKAQADKLSKQLGVHVLAIDLLNGKTAATLPEAQKLSEKIITAEAIKILVKAIESVKKLPETDSKKIGLLGFGLGGKIVLAAAPEVPGLKAVASVYGQPLLETDKLKKVKAPLLAIFAGEDKTIPLRTIETFDKALNDAHVDKRVEIIKGADQGFYNPTMMEFYNGKAALEAELIISEFLNQRLLQKY